MTVSDTSQGDGWWQASDDHWYPPESHPGYRPPPPVQVIGQTIATHEPAQPGPIDRLGVFGESSSEATPHRPMPAPPTVSNRLAIAALILGIVAVIFSVVLGGVVMGIPALICGYKSRRLSANAGFPGSGQSLAGIILGWIALPISIVVAVAVGVSALTHPSNGSVGSALYGVSLSGQPVTFTLKTFVDPATDAGGFSTDSSGSAHYAVAEIAATNTGDAAMNSVLSISVMAYGADGTPYEPVRVDPSGTTICADNSANSQGELSPNETLWYCESFVLPTSAKVVRIQLSATQNYGAGTVSWSVADGFSGFSGN